MRVNRGKVARGGATNRKYPSLASTYIHSQGLDKGRVLDFGCGYGIDAKTYGWEAYDPYYSSYQLSGKYDTVVCINVISAVSEDNQRKIIEEIRSVLAPDGIAYISVPRNLPKQGKLSGYHRRPQRYVILNEPSIYHLPQKYEIYKLKTMLQ